MNYVIDNIYIGNQYDAHNFSYLKLNNISYILVCGIEQEKPFQDNFIYLKFPIYDLPSVNISVYFCQALKFIHESQKKGKNILIHCAAGISRSASFVLAYLIFEKKLTYSEAIFFLKKKRNIIFPNEGFQKQLMSLSYHLYKKI